MKKAICTRRWNWQKARGLPVVATNDVRFIDSSDFDAHEIRVAIHDGFTLDDPKRSRNYSPQQYMRSEEEMCELFADIPRSPCQHRCEDRQTL
ncbi:hypothetical protein O5558_20360 [Escherichia coli]|nr:hypothetical protein [Escherichia coli]